MTVTDNPHTITYLSRIAASPQGTRPSMKHRATIEFTFESKNTPAPHLTTEHEPCPSIRELSWGVNTSNNRVLVSWERPSTLEAWLAEWELTLDYRWSMPEVERLFALGGEWHMNGLNAACAHQTVVWEDGRYGRQPSLTATEPCPQTGYRYGSAWLVRRLGEGVEAEVRSLMVPRLDAS